MTRLIAIMLLMATMSPADRYARAARAAGCPRDQWENFVRARIVLQPKQLLASAAARLCDHAGGPTKVGFGGSRGSAKSHWAVAQVGGDDCQRYPGLKFLYLRKVGKSGAEAIDDLRRSVLRHVPHEFKVQAKRLVFPNGSSIRLGHYQTESDIDDYLGLEYDGALIEEATQLSHRKVRDIGTCVRSSKPGWRPREYYTTNPGNVGHGWFKRTFIVPLRAAAESDTRFIQAYPWDNRFLKPEYRAKLDALTGWQREAWRNGNWDLAAGQYFTNFRRESVVVPAFTMPRHWRVWLGFDYGFSHFTCVYLMALDEDGNLFVVDEHAERGWLPERHAAAIRSMLARHGLRHDAGVVENGRDDLEAILAGWDCFNRDRRGKSIADDYADLGLGMERADADRINGAAEILRRLGDPDGDPKADPPIPPRPPTLFISERCPRLIECLPEMQRDEDRPEDVLKVDTDDDGLGGDDFYDSLRYGCMYVATDHTLKSGGDPFEGRRW